MPMLKSKRLSDIVDLRIASFDAHISSKTISQSIAQNDNLNVNSGQDLELQCTAQGRPVPEINWFKDGRLITSKSVSNSFMISKFGETSSLRIKNLSNRDAGTYACRAENINGYIRKWVFVKVSPKTIISTTSKPLTNSIKAKKIFRKNHCTQNTCNSGTCTELDNGATFKCKCPFPYSGDRCEYNLLLVNGKRNSSMLEEVSTACNKSSPMAMNDHIFTIFETVLVCLVASLFLGIICYISRKKYCCIFRNKKWRPQNNSQAIQAEINNFILVRDVGINVVGQYFEHGFDRLAPVAYNRHFSITHKPQFQEDSPHNCLFPPPPIPFMFTSLDSTANSQSMSMTPFIQGRPPSNINTKSTSQVIDLNTSTEVLHITAIKEDVQSESGICSCFECSPYLRSTQQLSPSLMIFNESNTPILSGYDSHVQEEGTYTSIFM